VNTLRNIVRIDRGTHRTRKRMLFCLIVGAERCSSRSGDEQEAQQLTKPNLQMIAAFARFGLSW
jgi:hypothetical protein